MKQNLIGFASTGYLDFQNRMGFKIACENPKNKTRFQSGKKNLGILKVRAKQQDSSRCGFYYRLGAVDRAEPQRRIFVLLKTAPHRAVGFTILNNRTEPHRGIYEL